MWRLQANQLKIDDQDIGKNHQFLTDLLVTLWRLQANQLKIDDQDIGNNVQVDQDIDSEDIVQWRDDGIGGWVDVNFVRQSTQGVPALYSD